MYAQHNSPIENYLLPTTGVPSLIDHTTVFFFFLLNFVIESILFFNFYFINKKSVSHYTMYFIHRKYICLKNIKDQ